MLFWIVTLVVVLIFIQVARRAARLRRKSDDRSDLTDLMGAMSMEQSPDNDKKRALREIVGEAVQQDRDALFEVWRRSIGRGDRWRPDAFKAAVDAAAHRIQHVERRTAALENDKVLRDRVSGYSEIIAYASFVDLVTTQAEFDALLWAIMESNNQSNVTRANASPLGAPYVIVQLRDHMGKKFGRPTMVRVAFGARPLGLVGVLETWLLNQIFLYRGAVIVTNHPISFMTRFAARILFVSVWEPQHLRLLAVPTW